MIWTALLASREVQRHTTSKNELDNIRALIARDLQDAALPQLSPDRQFATAYNAALQAAAMAIACEGYRVTARSGHHRITLECIRIIFGNSMDPFVDYLETCRRKRNLIDYANSQLTSRSEADEMLKQTAKFVETVEGWIGRNHAELRKLQR